MNSSSIDLGDLISLLALRARWSKFRFSLRAGITAALLVIGLLLAVRAVLYAQTSDLTGTYLADNVQVRAPGHIGAVVARGRGASETVPLWTARTLPHQPNKTL
jgi:hypothetical protein